jgi:general secretion pathway protein M
VSWLRQWWIGLSRRERLATLAAITLLAAAALYLAAIEPAWRTRSRLAAELPRLRAEAAELDALALEAKKLKTRTRALESPEQTKAALAKLLAEKSIAAGPIREGDGDRFLVSVRRAEAASWLAWLKDASTELPLRVASARISRVGPGLVDAEVALTPAGQK